MAAVQDDAVGEYTEWVARQPRQHQPWGGPRQFSTAIGSGTPLSTIAVNIGLHGTICPAADDYEVQVRSYDLATAGDSLATLVVTDNSFFHTAFGTASIRVRAPA